MIWLNVENVTIPKSVHSAMEQETTVETTPIQALITSIRLAEAVVQSALELGNVLIANFAKGWLNVKISK